MSSGRKDLFRRLNDELDRDDENDDGDQKGSNRFCAAMPERMFFVGGLFAHFEADDGHDVAAAVGEVVEPVGSDGDRAGNGADGNFSRGEQSIEHDTQDPRVASATRAYRGIGRIV